jgi:ribosomal protein S21
MPIIVKSQKGDDNNNMIKKFKKLLQLDDVVTFVRDRRYHKPPAVLKKEGKKELERKLKAERRMMRRRLGN